MNLQELPELYFWYRKWVSTYITPRKYCSHSCENDSLLEFWKNGRRFPLYSSKLTLTRNVSSKEKKSCSRQQFTRILTFLSLLHFLNRCKIQHRAKYHGIYGINQPCQNPPPFNIFNPSSSLPNSYVPTSNMYQLCENFVGAIINITKAKL